MILDAAGARCASLRNHPVSDRAANLTIAPQPHAGSNTASLNPHYQAKGDFISPVAVRAVSVDGELARLGRGGDLTSRVLGAGVVKRYAGRLLPVAKFLECAALARSFMKTPLARLLLRKARLTETTLRLTVLGLTADAARFAEKTPDTSTPKTPPQSPRKAPKPPTPLSAKRRIQSSTNLFGMVSR